MQTSKAIKELPQMPKHILVCTKRQYVAKKFTRASLVVEGSLATGFFCFKKLPEFKIGPDTLRREESIEVKPTGRLSSSAANTAEKQKIKTSNLC